MGFLYLAAQFVQELIDEAFGCEIAGDTCPIRQDSQPETKSSIRAIWSAAISAGAWPMGGS